MYSASCLYAMTGVSWSEKSLWTKGTMFAPLRAAAVKAARSAALPLMPAVVSLAATPLLAELRLRAGCAVWLAAAAGAAVAEAARRQW